MIGSRWQLNDFTIRPVAFAVLTRYVSRRMHLIRQAIVMNDFAGFDRHVVNQFKGLLRLDGTDDGGNCRSRRNLAEQDILASEQGTRISQRHFAAGLLGEGTFEARPLPWDEHSHQPQQLLNRAIDPGLVHPVAVSIDSQPCFAVVEAADDRIHPSNDSQSKLCSDVAVQVLNANFRIECLRSRGYYVSFVTAVVAFAKQDGSAQVGGL